MLTLWFRRDRVRQKGRNRGMRMVKGLRNVEETREVTRGRIKRWDGEL